MLRSKSHRHDRDAREPLARKLSPCAIGTTLLAVSVAGCNVSSGGGSSSTQAPPGAFVSKPDGSGLYVSDPNLDPGGSRLGLVEVFWGRAVDVYDLDANGDPESSPVFRDLVVRQELASDGVDYMLEVDPLTQETRLVVLRDADGDEREAFEALVLAATEDLPVVDPKADDGTAAPPFSMVPCNATLLLSFDDLLQDDAVTESQLQQLVRVRVGYTPTQPFDARIRFERNFGGVSDGAYHSTRVLVDPAVSELEAQGDATLTPNPFGLPASLLESGDASVSIRIPTRTDVTSGQFELLTNLRGRPLGTGENGPVDLSDPTQPVMRGIRAGNELDPDRGFLVDDRPPELLGDFASSIDAVREDPGGDPARLVVDLTFGGACRRAPVVGDVLESSGGLLQVRQPAADPDASGRVFDVAVRELFPDAPLDAYLGSARYVTPYTAGLGLDDACWARFLPEPTGAIGADVDPSALVTLRFSEPLDPRGLEALDGPSIVRGDEEPDATSIAPRVARLDEGLRELQLIPLVALQHTLGVAEDWRIVVADADRAVIDLAGNELRDAPGSIAFQLDPAAPSADTGGVVLRFGAVDEYAEFDLEEGAPDFRGQFSYDLERGLALPRPVQRSSWAVDSSQLLPSLMFPLPVSVPEPLMPLGSRLQTLWRYADVGWLVTDESRVDIDVEGISFAPFLGNVVADFFSGFELRLGHGQQLPDESSDSMGNLLFPSSGLLSAPNTFDDNFAQGRSGVSEIVHPNALGYLVDPTAVYTGDSGTRLLPLPLNQGPGPRRTFTWRDTSVLSTGGDNGSGIPMLIETSLGLYPDLTAGSIAGPGAVPSIGLPLLMELRTKPDSTALGLNGFQVAVARLGQLFPTWRVHASGGFDVSGNAVPVDPDLYPVPTGGYDPTSTPPGQATRPNDPTLYFGELQTVVRVSRAHSVWFDTGSADPSWGVPLQFPADADQPGSSRVVVEYRGAGGFVATNGAELDATRLDVYGDVSEGQVLFANNDAAWKASLFELSNARYVQLRITFENDIEEDVSPVLDALVLSFER